VTEIEFSIQLTDDNQFSALSHRTTTAKAAEGAAVQDAGARIGTAENAKRLGMLQSHYQRLLKIMSRDRNWIFPIE
jgi:hypothetical protein